MKAGIDLSMGTVVVAILGLLAFFLLIGLTTGVIQDALKGVGIIDPSDTTCKAFNEKARLVTNPNDCEGTLKYTQESRDPNPRYCCIPAE